MIRVQANVVQRYFDAVDEFVRIRLFTPEEIVQYQRDLDRWIIES